MSKLKTAYIGTKKLGTGANCIYRYRGILNVACKLLLLYYRWDILLSTLAHLLYSRLMTMYYASLVVRLLQKIIATIYMSLQHNHHKCNIKIPHFTHTYLN